MSDLNMSETDEMYPMGPEDSLQYIPEMPVYRAVGGQMFDHHPSITSLYNDSCILPEEDDLMVDPPMYHKGATKGGLDAGFAELLSQSDAISLIIPTSSSSQAHPSSSGSRPASPFASLLPTYDAFDAMLPLESTHLRVSCCCDGHISPCPELRETTLMSAINSYLQDHSEQIQVSAEKDLLESTTAGYWKCATGVLNDDFSWEPNYSSFAIQCYVDAADGNMIVEWQRRRGCVRMFHIMFEHFREAVSEHMTNACQRSSPVAETEITAAEASPSVSRSVSVVDSMTIVPSSHTGRVCAAVHSVSKLFIDPDAGVDTECEYTPQVLGMKKRLSLHGTSVELVAAALIEALAPAASAGADMPKLQREKAQVHTNISPTGPADMITMFHDCH